MKRTLSCAAVALLLLFSAVGAFAQAGLHSHSSFDYAMQQIAATHRFTEVAISPDGKRVAWVEDLQNPAKSVFPVSAIYVLELNSPSAGAKRVTGGEGTVPREEHDLAWSPDSRRLAFLSDRQRPGQLQLYIATAEGGAGTSATALKVA